MAAFGKSIVDNLSDELSLVTLDEAYEGIGDTEIDDDNADDLIDLTTGVMEGADYASDDDDEVYEDFDEEDDEGDPDESEDDDYEDIVNGPDEEETEDLMDDATEATNCKCGASGEKCCDATKKAKAGAICGKLDAKADEAEAEGLTGKADRYRSTSKNIGKKYGNNSAFDAAKDYGKSAKESAAIDNICYNLMHDIYSIGMESALNQLGRTLDSADIPGIESIVAAAIGEETVDSTNSAMEECFAEIDSALESIRTGEDTNLDEMYTSASLDSSLAALEALSTELETFNKSNDNTSLLTNDDLESDEDEECEDEDEDISSKPDDEYHYSTDGTDDEDEDIDEAGDLGEDDDDDLSDIVDDA